VLKTVCSRLQHERDVAEGKVRVLLARREAERRRNGIALVSNQIEIPRGIKRPREEMNVASSSSSSSGEGSVKHVLPTASSSLSCTANPHAPSEPNPPSDTEDSGEERLELSYPSPTRSPLPLSRSPAHVAELQLPVPGQQKRRRSQLPELPGDLTGFDLTILAPPPSVEEIEEGQLPLAKRRRVSGGSEMSDRTVVGEEAEKTPSSFSRVTSNCCPGGESQGECDMELESGSDTDTDVESGGEDSVAQKVSSKRESPSLSPGPTWEEKVASAASRTPTPTPTHLDLDHVDIMYIPLHERLVCRVCFLRTTSQPSSTSSRRTKQTKNKNKASITSFPTTAPWEHLREHCVKEHPSACADISRLGPEGICELRRRLLETAINGSSVNVGTKI